MKKQINIQLLEIRLFWVLLSLSSLYSSGQQIIHTPVDEFFFCGTTGQSVKEFNDIANNVIQNNLLRSSDSRFVSIANFGGAPEVCGHFNVYYDDYNFIPLDGFADPTLGPTRRQTLCAVLSYIESIIQFPSGQMDLFVQRSFSPTNPSGAVSFLAFAGPFLTAPTTDGIVDGYLHQHITTGIDPNNIQYDARVTVNFDQAAGQPICYDYINGPAPSCCYDLYSVLLHEMTHALGWISYIGEDLSGNFFPESNFSPLNAFSLFDFNYLYKGDILNPGTFNKLVIGTQAAPFINPLVNVPNALRSVDIWLNNFGPPRNQPVYSGTTYSTTWFPESILSHLDDQVYTFTLRSQFSPEYQATYVMGPELGFEVRKREWTLPELRTILSSGGLDYTVNTLFSGSTSLNGVDLNSVVIANQPPIRNNNSVSVTDLATFFPETMPVDFTVSNTAGVFTINLASDATLVDPDGGTVSIYPNSIFAIRGCSDGLDDHARLVQTSPTTINFSPIANYIGRAQFGFYLSDGHERGALKIYTIDVTGNLVPAPPATNIVINGGFEDGTEVRLRQTLINKPYTTVEYQYHEGFVRGSHLSGAHPGMPRNNNWSLAAGELVRYSMKRCFDVSSPASFGRFGFASNSLDNLGVTAIHPLPTLIPNNNRYSKLSTAVNFSTLDHYLEHCETYRLEFDVAFPAGAFTVGAWYNFNLEITDNPGATPGTQAVYQTVPINFQIASVTQPNPGTWQHVVAYFEFCGATNLQAHFLNFSAPFNGDGPYYDNISLTHDLPPMFTVDAGPDQSISPSCNSSGCVQVNADTTEFTLMTRCNLSYSWSPTTGVSNPNIANPTLCPTSTTTYTVTATDDCTGQTASDVITININPTGSCLSVNKTVSPSMAYALDLVTFSITVCNTGNTTQSFQLTDIIPPAMINVTSTIPNGAITLGPNQCNQVPYTVTGNFNMVGQHCNTVVATDGFGNQVSEDACIEILQNCPANVQSVISGCTAGSSAVIGVYNHIPISANINFVKAKLIYPNFLTPPSVLNTSTVTVPGGATNLKTAYCSISTPVPHPGYPGGGGINYNILDFQVSYNTPLSSPSFFCELKFVLNAAPPAGVNTFYCWVVDPNTGSVSQIRLGLTGGNSYNFWTQPLQSVIPNCNVQGPNADFTIEQNPCTGEVMVISSLTGPSVTSKWEWGDNRTTPVFGADLYTYDYYSTITAGTNGPINPPIGPALPGTYTITHTVYYESTASILTKNVTLYGPCCSATTVIPDGALSSQYGGLLSGSIDIQGEFIIDQPTSFQNCTITMEPASRIFVQSSVALLIDQTTIGACSNMWKGIYLDADAHLDVNRSTIRDAQYAVYANDKSFVGSYDSKFENNYVGIYIPPQSGYNNVGMIISATKFRSTSALHAMYTGQTPQIGYKGFAGIEAHKTTVSLTPAAGNEFTDLNAGILLYESDMNISNMLFKNIQPDLVYTGLQNGCGIYSNTKSFHSLSVYGHGYFNTPTFINCKYGVYTYGDMNIHIKGNEMQLMENGIRVDVTNEAKIEIYSNHIQGQEIGIALNQNDYSYTKRVIDNYIDMGQMLAGTGVGIKVDETGIPNPDQGRIEENHINLYDWGQSGISIRGAADYGIRLNSIQFHNPITNLFGIALRGTSKSLVSCNSISNPAGYLNSRVSQTGIYSSISKDQTIQCNDVNGVYNGYLFTGANPNTDFKGNVTSDNFNGLHLSGSSVIDPQKLKGNIWPSSSSYGNLGALNENTNYYIYSQFEVDNNSDPQMLPPTFDPPGWFVYSIGPNFMCQSSEPVCPKRDHEHEGVDLDKDIANNLVQTVEYNAEVQKSLEQYLFEKLKDNIALRDTDSVFTAFYQSLLTSDYAALKNIKEKGVDMYNFGNSFDDVVNYSQSIDQKMDTIIYNDSLYSLTSTSLIQKSTLIANNFGLRESIRTLQSLISNLLYPIKQTKVEKADIAIGENISLFITDQMLQNEKSLNNVYFNTLAKGNSEFSDIDASTLLGISMQCPIMGGEAVYKARGIYSMIDANIDWDDFALCSQSGSPFRFKANSVSAVCTIFPNPTSGHTKFVHSFETDNQMTLEIYDLEGRLSKRYSIPPRIKGLDIDLSDLHSGVYFFHVVNEKNSIFTGRVTITN